MDGHRPQDLTGSISFDRAAEYYDRTRALSDSVMARVVELLQSNLPAGELCLEIGIGTGRIAVPLAQRGVRVAGVDISRQMLSKLRGKVGEGWPQVAIADATHLPFAGRTFGGAIAAHVLHLIPEWKVAVESFCECSDRAACSLPTAGRLTRTIGARRSRTGSSPRQPGSSGLPG